MTLDEVSCFEHRDSSTIWLGGQSQQLLDLQSGLQAAFPEFVELNLDPQREVRGFRPHLSLGQWQHANLQPSLQVPPPGGPLFCVVWSQTSLKGLQPF